MGAPNAAENYLSAYLNQKLNNRVTYGFLYFQVPQFKDSIYFDDNYLFSDAVSLYLKGVNIFPDIFGDQWRKYAPIISLKEIYRVVGKTLEKEAKIGSKQTHRR